MSWRKCLALMLAVLMAAAIGAGCRSQAPAEEAAEPEEATEAGEEGGPDYGGTARLSTWSAPTGMFSPILHEELYDYNIIELVYDAMLYLDEELMPQPEVAESWEISDDGLSVTFHLRKDVKFHDGHPVTAEDVAFTFKSMCHPEYQGVRFDNFKKIKGAIAYHEGTADDVEGIEVLDDYTIRFTTIEPYAPLMVKLSYQIEPEHLRGDVPPADLPKHDTNSHPIGCGPFKFVKYETDQYIQLEAFDDYFRGRPYLDGIIFKILSQDVALAQIEAGEVDTIEVTPADIEAVEDIPGVHIWEYADLGYQYMGINTKREPFDDKRVRHAITHAIDKVAIVDKLLMGHGTVMYSHMPPTSWAYTTDIPQFEYSPEKAKELLAEAGWTDVDNDGILEKGDKEFKVTLLYPVGNKVREQSAPVIQQYLKDVGIDCQLEMMEFATLVPRIFDERDFDLYLMGWSLSVDPDPQGIWHSSQAKPGGWNPCGFVSQESDDLMNKACTTFNMDERKKYYAEWQRLIADAAPYVFLYSMNNIYAVNDRLKEFKPGPQDRGWNCWEWWIPESEQID